MAEQLHSLLAKVARELGLDAPSLQACQPLVNLGITPGDVAAVVRRQVFVPVATVMDLLEAVLNEGRFKPDCAQRAMGFV